MIYSILFYILFLLFSRQALAAEFTSTNFKILDPVLSIASSTEMASTNFRLIGVMGEAVIGTSTAASFNISSGFLYFPFIKTPKIRAQAGNGRVALHWTRETGFLGWTVGGYTLGKSAISGGPYTYISVGNTTVSATSSLANGLTNGTTYYFIVGVEDIFGNIIATSSEVSVTPSANFYNLLTADFPTDVASSTSFVAKDGIKVDITVPVHVLTNGDMLQPVFTALTKEAAIDGKPLPNGKLGADTFYDFSWFKADDHSHVTSFDKPISLKFSYTDDDIGKIDESTLAPYRWDGSSWTVLDGYVINTSANTITVDTKLFSSFALIGTESSSITSVPSSSVVQGYKGEGGIIESPRAPGRVTWDRLGYLSGQIAATWDHLEAALTRPDFSRPTEVKKSFLESVSSTSPAAISAEVGKFSRVVVALVYLLFMVIFAAIVLLGLIFGILA
ncbi:MAG: hypothetical protein HYW91_00500 [Candidatus Sungbacteria bacterium]|nr:hypothetical protein [Candidatus Sungbacteria bacterium]